MCVCVWRGGGRVCIDAGYGSIAMHKIKRSVRMEQKAPRWEHVCAGCEFRIRAPKVDKTGMIAEPATTTADLGVIVRAFCDVL